jgi:hypothetical protein
VVLTVSEEGPGGLRGARDACRELAPEAALALEGHGSDRVFTEAVGSLRVRLIPAVALGCCVGEDMHAPTERIRAGSIGAGQLQAVRAEILD